MSAAQNLDRTFLALADPTRRAVVEHLRRMPHRAGDLAEALETSAPAMSRHLKILRASGLVELEGEDEDDARVRVYRLRRKPFDELETWVRHVEEYWSVQMESFRSYTEGTRKLHKKKQKSR